MPIKKTVSARHTEFETRVLSNGRPKKCPGALAELPLWKNSRNEKVGVGELEKEYAKAP